MQRLNNEIMTTKTYYELIDIHVTIVINVVVEFCTNT